MFHSVFKVLFVLILLGTSAKAQSSCDYSPYIQQKIQYWWDYSKAGIKQNFIDRLEVGDINRLYTLQGQINNVVRFAGSCNKPIILNEISNIILESVNYLEPTTSGRLAWICSKPGCHLYNNPGNRDKENILISSQFLNLVSSLLDFSSQYYTASEYTDIKHLHDSLGNKNTQGSLGDHLQRWIYDEETFSVAGYGCSDRGKYTLEVFTPKLRNRTLGNEKSLCNRVDDKYWHIATALVHYLNLTRALPSVYQPLSVNANSTLSFEGFIHSYLLLHRSRLSFANGDPNRLLFDAGANIDGTDGKYSLYEGGYLPPTSNEFQNLEQNQSPDWDSSHYVRMVELIKTLMQSQVIQNEAPFNTVWRDAYRISKKMANQLAHTIYTDPSTGLPLLSTYVNGRRGWYKLNYDSNNLGHPPGSFTALLPRYGAWMSDADNYSLDQPLQKLIDVIERFRVGNVSANETEYVRKYLLTSSHGNIGSGFSGTTLLTNYSGLAFGNRFNGPTPTPTPTFIPTSTASATPTPTATQTPEPTTTAGGVSNPVSSPSPTVTPKPKKKCKWKKIKILTKTGKKKVKKIKVCKKKKIQKENNTRYLAS